MWSLSTNAVNRRIDSGEFSSELEWFSIAMMPAPASACLIAGLSLLRNARIAASRGLPQSVQSPGAVVTKTVSASPSCLATVSSEPSLKAPGR